MSIEPIKQILTHLLPKRHILITTRAHPSGDAVASALAFYLILKKAGKRADVVIAGNDEASPGMLSFLPGYASILRSLPRERSITLAFPLQDSAVRSLTYRVREGKLLITVSPEGEAPLDLGNVEVRRGSYPYDAVVVVDAADLESLGALYDEHTEFFYHAPIINIDHQAENEHFGELNLVELTAASTTEILFSIIEHWDKSLLDADIATCLLAGIIMESKSFQSPSLTPRTLSIAAELVSAGARRALITERLFGPRPIETLQLWGRTLARLKTDPERGVIWSSLETEDIAGAESGTEKLASVIEHLLAHVQEARAVILTHPTPQGIRALVHAGNPLLDLRRALAHWNPYGTRGFVACDMTPLTAERAVEAIADAIAAAWPDEKQLPKF